MSRECRVEVARRCGERGTGRSVLLQPRPLESVVAIGLILVMLTTTRQAQAQGQWMDGPQCTAAAVPGQLQLATRTDAPFPGSEETHRIAEGCFWDRHPDKSIRAPLSDPNDPLPNYFTLYICNNCKISLTVGVRDILNAFVLPQCPTDWPTTTVAPGASVLRNCVTGSNEGERTDYTAIASANGVNFVGLDPEIVLEDNGWGFVYLDEIQVRAGQHVAFLGRSTETLADLLRAQGALVGLPATGHPAAFVLLAPTAQEAAAARLALDKVVASRTTQPLPPIWLIDPADVTEDQRTARLKGAFSVQPGNLLFRSRRGYTVVRVGPAP